MKRVFTSTAIFILIIFFCSGCSFFSNGKSVSGIIRNAAGFPATKGRLSKIKSISFENTGLKTVPEKVKYMKNLEKLDLRNNKIRNLPTFIKKLPKLKEINLSGNGLKEFPVQLLEIISIHKIVLNNNSIEKIPGEIKSLTSLSELDIAYNKLTELSEGFKELSALKYLDVSGNAIKNIDNLNFSAMFFLNFENNKVEALPDALFTPELTILKAGKNKLRTIPDSIRESFSLKTLELQDNDIYYFPDQLNKLKSLKSLNLSRNNLTYFPSQLCEIVSLENLWINGNKIGDLPYLVIKLINLNKLYLDNNAFYQFPTALYNVGANLTELSMKNNHISYLPLEIKEKMKLAFFYLNNNPVRDIHKELSGWKKDDVVRAIYNKASGEKIIIL